MNFELIIIGNELLNGKIQDLNTHFLAKYLYQHGHHLRKTHLIGDDQESFNQALTEAWRESDYVITTGGLGPTKDDLTKQFLADFFEKEVIYNPQAEEVTRKNYAKAGRKYNPDKIDYKNLPLEFSAIFNPIGFAPGFYYEENQKKVFCTPGVPGEFQQMVMSEIFPQHVGVQSKSLRKHFIVQTWKISEANIFFKVDPSLWEKLSTFGSVSSLPQPTGVEIGVELKAESTLELAKKETELTQVFQKSPLAEYIWHIGPEAMEEVIIQEAMAKNLTLGFAESCTGGLLASRITDISGSSSVFWGSIISYANEVKEKSLGVKSETLANFGAVSSQTALEMAVGARKNLAVDIAVTTTGIAGPTGGSKEKPVGTVGIGVASAKSQESEMYYFKGNRTGLKKIFADAALIKMLEEIRKH